MEKRVVERFAAVFCGLDEHLEVFHHLALSAEIIEFERAEGVFKVFLGRVEVLLFSYVKVFCHSIVIIMIYF